MAADPPSEFQFNSDDQDAETFYREEIKDLRVEKLSQRVTLISILLPCLIAVAIYFGYRDVTGRVTQSQDTRSLEVQRLSGKIDELSRRFNEKLITFSTTLSTQDKDFDTLISERLKTINDNFDVLFKDLKTLNENLKQTTSSIKKLNASKADKKTQEAAIKKLSTSKVDKKSQAAAIAKIYAALEPLNREMQTLADIRRDLKAVSSEIMNLESKLTKDIAKVAANTEQSRKNYADLQASITSLSGEKIDKATLDLEVFKLKKNFQNTISQAINGLNQKMDSIQKKIEEMQISARSFKRSMKSASKKISPSSTTTEKTGSNKETLPSESGAIDEQDLLE
jgi:DNA repair exonuclease SbcCD ATPase subunit